LGDSQDHNFILGSPEIPAGGLAAIVLE
jgi:hypothetical protein